ncbi:MAG: hypothetical protein AB1757_23795 [Acidobacteriota bacterium]
MKKNVSKFLTKIAKKERNLTIPEIALIGGTRAALGAGVGLLLAGKLNDNPRRAVGMTLFLVGALSTIPIVRNVLAKSK